MSDKDALKLNRMYRCGGSSYDTSEDEEGDSSYINSDEEDFEYSPLRSQETKIPGALFNFESWW